MPPPASVVVGATTTAASPASVAGTITKAAPPIAAPRTTAVAPAPAPEPDPVLARAGSAGQVVVGTAGRYGATTATLTAYERDGATAR